MELKQAISLIKEGINSPAGTWADIGAGTGLFTLALTQLLDAEARIIAADKNPHALYRLQGEVPVVFEIEEVDFNKPMNLPLCDGIILANTLHYAKEPLKALQNILGHLKTGGRFILIEYDTDRPVSSWVPYPVNYNQFKELSRQVGLSAPVRLAETPSRYGNGMIYTASCDYVRSQA